MAAGKKRRRRPQQPLDAFRRIRKPMPPPERVVDDERPRTADRLARREVEVDLADRDGRPPEDSEDTHVEG